jgi:aspartyl-tRNA synthetase
VVDQRRPARAPTGTHDIFWPESWRWEVVLGTFATAVERAGYGLLQSPMFEYAEIFRRGIGEASDVVGKEMYEFADRDGQMLALRPEGTASVVRAFVEHHPLVPWKVWYATPAFRHERPQAGRYRQHHQVGVEALGPADPDLDAEVVALADGFFRRLGLTDYELKVNSMGDGTCRPAYLELLRSALAERVGELCDEHRRRLDANPLRVLDCKRPECRKVTADVPHLVDHLCDTCAAHFDRVREGLAALGVPYVLDHRLVRGFDYYTRTTFEFASGAIDAAQNGIGGGGRYDGLVEMLGGPPTPGIGFGVGIERVLIACDGEGVLAADPPALDTFVVDVAGGEMARDLTAAIRRAGLRADRAFDGRSMKAQMKLADRSGARLALIVGPGELADGTVTVRPLREEGGQRTVPVGEAVTVVEPEAQRTEVQATSMRTEVQATSMRTEVQATSMRTDLCGGLGLDDVGREVRLCGWVAHRREHGEHLAFVDLRDHSGIVQCVVDGAADLRSEYVVAVTGVVRRRPQGMDNPQLATGQIEVGDCAVAVLAEAEPPPFPVDDRAEVDEVVRLRHRYVDLRRPRLQANLRLRAAVTGAIRRSFDRQGFCEVETPLLWAPTPEGAREFAVPSRLHRGSFYVLPQSPQLAKQLLMVGGLDRYYQIARCLRDEDLRADRQFEFTQLDMEASFVDGSDVMGFVSEAVLEAAEVATGERPPPIARMTWDEAMNRYGTDKPDLRFGMELVDLTEVFASTGAKVLAAPVVKALRLEGGGSLSRSRLDALVDQAKTAGAKGLAWFRVVLGDDGPALDSPLDRFLSVEERTGMLAATGGVPGDLLLVVADQHRTACTVLGQLRLAVGGRPVGEGPHRYVWVVEFPMFDGVDAEGNPVPAHHPFTMPHPDDLDLLASDPAAVRSQAYDLVLNGWELGSGSVRIHRADIQSRVFDALGISAEEAASRFGFLLGAFRYGAPPHAGFAFGVDRLVALLSGEENIREVIAFPKTQSGADPLTGAPKPLTPAALAELGIRPVPPPGGAAGA